MDIDNLGMIEQKFWKHEPQVGYFLLFFSFHRVQTKLQALRDTSNIEKVFVKEDLSRDNGGLKKFLFWTAAP